MLTARAFAADTFIGPAFPPTGSAGFAFAGSGALGATGGRTLTYSGLSPDAYVSIYWGPSTLDATKISLNSTSATYILALSASTATNATFTNASVPYTSPGGPGAYPSGNYIGRGTLDLTGAAWVTPPVGIGTSIVTNLTGLSGFSALGQWTSNVTGSYTPINTLPVPASGGGVASSFGGGFFYIPRLTWTGASGNWDTLTNWNHQSVAPYASSPVTIAVAGSVNVTGPAAATTVKSLMIGGTAGSSGLTLGTGTLTATDGTTIANNGVVSGAGSLGGAVNVLPGGVLKVTGPLNIAGNLSSSGTISTSFGGTTVPLTCSGAVSLSGTSNLALAPGISDAPYNATYPLISGATRTGTFGSISNIALTPTKHFAVLYDAYSVKAVVARPGNANLDGYVDFADLVLLAQNYNFTGTTWLQGDFDGNGTVQFADLVALAQNYNAPASFTADWARAQALAPEPASLLAIVGVAFALRRRW